MWQVRLAAVFGAIFIGIIAVVLGSVITMRPIQQEQPVKRKKRESVVKGTIPAMQPQQEKPTKRKIQKSDELSDIRSGFYSAVGQAVSIRSEDDDDEYHSAEEFEEEELDLLTLLYKIDKKFGLDNEILLEESFKNLKECQEKFPNNSEVLWRLARCCHFLSTYFEEQERKWINEGCDYASQALKIQRTADTLQWFAILEGRRCQFCNFSDQIKFAQIFKNHIEEAINLRPQDAFLHYLMANFYFQTVSNVPYLMKWFAERIVGAGTIEDALYYASKAEDLSSRPMKQNKLLLVKCLLYKDNKVNKPRVLNLLYEASCIEVITPEDKEAHEEILTLEKSLK